MTNEEKNCIKIDINEIKRDNIEELWLIFKCFINCYISSGFKMGLNNQITKETIIAFKEFYNILKKEKYILNSLIENYNNLDFDEVIELLNDLDILNEKTFNYYYSVFDNIEDATLTKEEYRAKRYKKDFDTLIETDKYEKRLKKY
ncbi:MAG: hypothetical protein IJ574_05180 [Bacilli bacterium]|nr:hypothetical protein [Bacilli bacterium]